MKVPRSEVLPTFTQLGQLSPFVGYLHPFSPLFTLICDLPLTPELSLLKFYTSPTHSSNTLLFFFFIPFLHVSPCLPFSEADFCNSFKNACWHYTLTLEHIRGHLSLYCLHMFCFPTKSVSIKVPYVFLV